MKRTEKVVGHPDEVVVLNQLISRPLFMLHDQHGIQISWSLNLLGCCKRWPAHMNLSQHATNDKELLYANFNQDFTCVSIGTKTGYRIFNCEPFSKCYGDSEGGIGVAEMLFCTSLVVLVGAGEQPSLSPRRLRVVNTKTKETISELNFVSAVLGVRLNKQRMVVVLETKIHVFDLSTLKILQTLDTAPNPKGLFAFSSNEDNNYLAFPANGTSGEVFVFDAIHLHAVNRIPAHKTPLAAMSFSRDGTMLATASEKGTVIRVFSVRDVQRTHQFRRGSYSAAIYSLSFNAMSTVLCVSSDTGTVHVFRLDQPQASSTQTGAIVTNYLPEVLSEMWEPSRDFAHVKLRTAGVRNLVGVDSSGSKILVLTADGYLYQYGLDYNCGGECVLEKENILLESDSDEISARFV